MALITTHVYTTVGTAPTMGAAASGDTAECGPGYTLELENTNAATRDITIVVPGNLETGDAYPDKTYTIAATTGRLRVPLLNIYKDSTGYAAISYSPATTGVTRAVTKSA